MTRPRSSNSSSRNELGEGRHIYFNARYYDPEVGRCLTEDPSRKAASWYTYCDNNPLTFTDPTGRLTEEEKEERRANRRERWERFKERVREVFSRCESSEKNKDKEMLDQIKEVVESEEVGSTANVISSVLTMSDKIGAGALVGGLGTAISGYKYLKKAKEGQYINIELVDLAVSASGFAVPEVPLVYGMGKLTYNKAIEPMLTEVAEFEVGVRRDPIKLFDWMADRYLLSPPRF